MRDLGDFKRCRLLVLLSASTAALSLVGYLGKNNVYADNSVDLIKSPQLAVVFEGMEQGKYPWDIRASDSKQTAAPARESRGSDGQDTTVGEKEESFASQESGEGDGKNSESAPLFTTVDQSYFDDALFIGDSRTVGLSQYSGWKNPVYYADVGLTIYDVFDKKIAEVNGETLTIDKALEKKKFGKIYIMLGINELGRGTTEKFADRYSQVIGRIRELQPDAAIFIEGIMRVSKKKSDTDPIFNNKNINDRNAAIEKLADNASIFYIDVNQAIADETGGIPADYTFDNVHLKAAYYHIWTDFLLAHGIIRNP